MIWKTWPISAVWVIGTLVGFGILFTAFTRLMLSLELRRAAGGGRRCVHRLIDPRISGVRE